MYKGRIQKIEERWVEEKETKQSHAPFSSKWQESDTIKNYQETITAETYLATFMNTHANDMKIFIMTTVTVEKKKK